MRTDRKLKTSEKETEMTTDQNLARGNSARSKARRRKNDGGTGNGRQPIRNEDSSPRGTKAAASSDTTRGRVASYSVGDDGLIVHLDVSALNRIAFRVGADEPHFRSAVSMTMIALNNRVNPATQDSKTHDQQWLHVSMRGSKDDTIRPAKSVAMSYKNELDPFDSDDWVVRHQV